MDIKTIFTSSLLSTSLLMPSIGSAETPVAPTMAVTLSDQLLQVNWSDAANAVGYNLYYAPIPYTGPDSIGSIDMAGAMALAAELPIASAYYVAVTAYNNDGESGYSNIGSFTISNPVTDYSYQTLWTHSANLDVPESVLYNASENLVYVSNISGSPLEKNGNGFISTLDLDGNLVAANAFPNVTLNAPKGMALNNNKLYIADIDQLVEIDLSSGTATSYAAPESLFLNDVAADLNGNIYVSDTDQTNSVIYQLSGGEVSVWFDDSESLSRPNGLVVSGGKLLVGSYANGTLLSIDLNTKAATPMAETEITIDGLLPDGNGNYFLSDWDGKLYWMNSSGVKKELYDGESNVADFEYIKESNLILMPTFFGNSVVAIEVTPQHTD